MSRNFFSTVKQIETQIPLASVVMVANKIIIIKENHIKRTSICKLELIRRGMLFP
jgi:hypothetical protein